MANVSIDMDKTIQNLLKTYGDYVVKMLDFDGPRIIAGRFNDSGEKNMVVEGYYRARQACDFLQNVINDPQKYLYYPYDIIYNGFDYNGNPGVQYSTPSVYDKLEAIEDLVRARTDLNVLYRLSESISYHILVSDYKNGDKWTYSGGDDDAAKNILQLNKKVHLMGKDNITRLFVGMVPARRFAVKCNTHGGK